MLLNIPGTVMPYDERAGDNTYALISPIVELAGGISLSQLSAATGIEGTTIQNWVKRGWVPPSVGKKYGERSVVRILLINILRGALKLEDITRLLRYVNGEVLDVEDDIMHDTQLYDLLCSCLYEVERQRLQSSGEIRQAIKGKIPEGLSDEEASVLENTLLIMTQSAMAGYYKALAESEYEKIDIPNIGGGKMK